MSEPFFSALPNVVYKFPQSSLERNTLKVDGNINLALYIPGCGDMFTRPRGNFTSPNYPNTYPHGVTCEWSIVTDYGSVIELTINDLDIEMGKDCYDKLEVIAWDEVDYN